MNLVGSMKRGLADEEGFVDEANDRGGATEKAVLCFASWDGAGGEQMRTGTEMPLRSHQDPGCW